MKLNALLNYQLHQPATPPQIEINQVPIVLIHGLFGDLNNLGVLARDLRQDNIVIQIDVRNHGHSPHSNSMNYLDMAQDVITLLDSLNIAKAIVIGHSMGGKIAMAMTALAPDRLDKVVVIDMSPVAYNVRRHDKIFTALEAVTEAKITRRQDAIEIMRPFINEEGVIQFLLKSFKNGQWLFNLPALKSAYPQIIGWDDVSAWQHPILFIRGGLSPYILDEYHDDIARQFPKATGFVVANTGHWVHSEKPEAVLKAIRRFLAKA
ncbi:esterase [Proteus hauseri ATCC 700826]|uniref:Esterase n=1 Tax=Proteus hauseri ATCC 700826 TaxID=1354271 RepID=A0AAJ3HT05_PROHU|nr:esterase [Proteus hauseri]OAT47838.1 esterase [Proteus hauseri ATCC 700826]